MTSPFFGSFASDATRTRPAQRNTIGPRTTPYRAEDEEGYENPYLSALKTGYGLLQHGAFEGLASLVPGGRGLAPLARMMGEGLTHDARKVYDAVRDVNQPGSAGREGIFNAALPLALNFYPMGGGPVAAGAERGAARVLADHGDDWVRGMAAEFGERAGGAARGAGADEAADAAIMQQMRSTPMDVSHYTDDELAHQAGLTTKRLHEATDPGLPMATHDSRLGATHDAEYLRALESERAVRAARGQQAAAGPARARPGAESREQTLAHEQGYDHAGPGMLPGAGGGRQLLKGGLSKEEAVALNKEQNLAGVASEMRRSPDGTFEVWQKGAGAAPPKAAERAAARSAREEKAFSVLSPEEGQRYDELKVQIDKRIEERGAHPVHTEEGDTHPEFARLSREMRPLRDEFARLDDRVASMTKALDLGMTDDAARQYAAKTQEVYDIRHEIGEFRKGPTYNTPENEFTAEDKAAWEAFEALQRRHNDVTAEVNGLELDAKAATSTGGLMPSEAKQLAALRESREQIMGGLRQFEAMNDADDPRLTHEMAVAYDEARKHESVLARDIEALQGREHLPPRAERALVKAEPKELAPRYTYEGGRPNAESGFQSRAVTVLEREYAGQEPRSAAEWKETLLADERIPKEEVEAVMDDSNMLQMEEQSPAGDGKITSEQIAQKFRDDSPASTLEVRSSDADGVDTQAMDEDFDARMDAAREQLTRERERWIEQAAREEEDYVRERRSEDTDERINEILGIRDTYLEDFKSTVNAVLGDEAGERFLASLDERETFLDDPEDLYEGVFATAENLADGGGAAFNAADYDHYLDPRFREKVRAFLDDLLPADGRQLSISDDIRPEFTPEQHEQLRGMLDSALDEQEEALGYGKERFEGYNDDEIAREARESIEENIGEYSDVPDPDDHDAVVELAGDIQIDTPRASGNTEYSGNQRIDDNAPYKEIKVYSPGVGKAGHFQEARDLAAWARVEIHDDTYVMIEAQSDIAQRARRSGSPPSSPLVANTDRWAKLSTGAALADAARMGKDWFGWATPTNRMSAAGLAKQAADITYGKAVPKALKDFWRQLGLGKFPEVGETDEIFRIRLTEEQRKIIREAGLPALGIGAAVASSDKGE